MQSFEIRSRLCCRATGTEDISGTLQQLAFPLNDLIRMNIEPSGQLRQGLFGMRLLPFKR